MKHRDADYKTHTFMISRLVGRSCMVISDGLNFVIYLSIHHMLHAEMYILIPTTFREVWLLV